MRTRTAPCGTASWSSWTGRSPPRVYTMTALQLTDELTQLATAAARRRVHRDPTRRPAAGAHDQPARSVPEPVGPPAPGHRAVPVPPAGTRPRSSAERAPARPAGAVHRRCSTTRRAGQHGPPARAAAGRADPPRQPGSGAVRPARCRHGRPARTIDVASLRHIDAGSLHDHPHLRSRLSLRRPNPLVQRLTQKLAAEMTSGAPAANIMARSGFPIPGQTAAAVVTNLIWRTFGPHPAGRAESVLDWAGLHGNSPDRSPRSPHRHHTTPATLTNRIRHVTNRGAKPRSVHCCSATPPDRRNPVRTTSAEYEPLNSWTCHHPGRSDPGQTEQASVRRSGHGPTSRRKLNSSWQEGGDRRLFPTARRGITPAAA